MYLGDAERLEYRILEPSGQLQRIVRVPGEDLRISEEELEKEKDLYLASNRLQGS